MIEVYDLRRLPEDGAKIDEALSREWLEDVLNEDVPDPGMKIGAKSDGQAKLEIRKIGGEPGADPTVRVRGRVTADLVTACVRCLADVEFKVDCTADLTLFPAKGEPRPERAEPTEGKGRLELSKTTLDEGTYRDHQIDLPSIVREAILLEVAMNPSCEDAAACEARTARLIEAAGAKTEKEPDPRWAGPS
jgi:uncharacterized metal-binding protein YceD (DUF177 family)